MDLAYLRHHPQHLPTFLEHQRIRETPVTGGSICQAARLTLDDGNSIFAKTWSTATPSTGLPTASSTPPSPGQSTAPSTGTPAPPTGASAPSTDGSGSSAARPTGRSGPSTDPSGAPGQPPEGFFAAEAAGLSWLREADAVPIPEIIAALPGMLALEWIDAGEPSPRAAEELGRGLARLHRSGADTFGAAWPGYIGWLPMDNEPSPGPWPHWFAAARLEPYLRMSADRGALSPEDVCAVEKLLEDIDRYAGPAAGEPPARIHGDLWPGNVLWAESGRAYLVDPAAHGGHRETDLANLALFGGAPYLNRILDGYQDVWPLAPEWERRVPLHQLHLLLVHTAQFGSTYRRAVMSAVRATVEQ